MPRGICKVSPTCHCWKSLYRPGSEFNPAARCWVETSGSIARIDRPVMTASEESSE